MPDPSTPHDGVGTVLNLFGTVYTVTNIVISNSARRPARRSRRSAVRS
jgi:hypothetical protein